MVGFLILFFVSKWKKQPITIGLKKFGSIQIGNAIESEHKQLYEELVLFFDMLGKTDSHGESVVEIVRRITTNHIDHIARIKYKETISNQMIYVEEMLLVIKTHYADNYKKLLIPTLGKNESPTLSKFYRDFQVLLTSVLENIKKNILKPSLTTNIFIDLEDNEFQDYIQRKIKTTLTSIEHHISTLYDSNNNVKIDSLLELNLEKSHETITILNDVYVQVKKIIKTDGIKMQQIKSELDNELSTAIAGSPCHLHKIKIILNKYKDKIKD